jgi:hypothetical protein
MDADQFDARSSSRIAAGSGAAGGSLRASRNRRATVRLLAGGALAAPATLRASSTGAVKGWCRRDPIVKIGERTVQIILRTEAAMHGLATGPTQLVIHVPVGVATRFVADDPGFGRYGYDVSFAESHELTATSRTLDVQVEAYAPADPAADPLPVVLEVTPLGDGRPVVNRAEGRANEWVRLRASFTLRDHTEPGGPPPDNPSPPGKPDPKPSQPSQPPQSKTKGGKGRKRSSS